MWEVSGTGLVVRVDIAVVTYEAMTPQCGRSVVQFLFVRVDIEVVIYETMTPQCGGSVVVGHHSYIHSDNQDLNH